MELGFTLDKFVKAINLVEMLIHNERLGGGISQDRLDRANNQINDMKEYVRLTNSITAYNKFLHDIDTGRDKLLKDQFSQYSSFWSEFFSQQYYYDHICSFVTGAIIIRM
jgi:hypothetical protein